MKKLVILMLFLASLSSSMNVRAYDEGETVLASVYVYSSIQGNVPLTFSQHDVMYENVGQCDPLNPTMFYCQITGVVKYPFERALVIPETIGIGIYRMVVTGMPVGCFQQTGIKSVDFRACLRTIPQSSFMYCTDLESVEFHGNSPHFIETSAFRGCTKLDGIRFPAQLKYIGDNAFDGCLSLSEVYIPKDVAYLGAFAFNYCISLTKVDFATGHFRTIGERCFYNCERLEQIEIPEGVSELGVSSFQYSGLKSIVLPSTLRIINNYALSNTPVVNIYCKALTPPKVGVGWTNEDMKRIRLHVPRAVIDAYRTDPFWSHFNYIEPY